MTHWVQHIKALLPKPFLRALQKLKARRFRARYANLSTQEVFTQIYANGNWGKSADPAQKFYSGSGSHDSAALEAYAQAVQVFLSGFAAKPKVLDLGCGDFAVGSRVRHLCGAYTGADIVEPLIRFNQDKYRGLDVEFVVLDLITDPLPPADIVFVRQVFQHLSNDQISRALQKIVGQFRYLVLTEHLPPAGDSSASGTSGAFVANTDKPAGPETRLMLDSGVVLTQAPFHLKPSSEQLLCRVADADGEIVSIAYALGPGKV